MKVRLVIYATLMATNVAFADQGNTAARTLRILCFAVTGYETLLREGLSLYRLKFSS